jgi:hypothetical protein
MCAPTYAVEHVNGRNSRACAERHLPVARLLAKEVSQGEPDARITRRKEC